VIDKLSSQTRIIIATVLSFLFFATYDHFFISKKIIPQDNNTTTQVIQKTSTSSAPNMSNVNVSTSPQVAKISKKSKNIDAKDIAIVRADNYELHIDRFGRISKMYLTEPKYVDTDGRRIQLIDEKLSSSPLEVRFGDENINTQAFATPYLADKPSIKVSKEGTSLKLTQSLSGLEITKNLTFYPDGHYDLHVSLSTPKEYFITPGFRPEIAIDKFTFHGAVIKNADDTLTDIADGDAKNNETFTATKIVSSVNKYYTTSLYNFDKGLDVVVSQVGDKLPLLFIKGKNDLKLHGYIGPKKFETLKSIDPRLTDIIEYGFFTFVARPVFKLLLFLHSFLGNWGWSIVAMTILIRLVLFPLTYKGMVSMNKLKELAPKIKELKEKYKDDKQKLNVQTMEMYKKHGANPMGGCLPMILQIPVFFSIYRVLQNTIEIKSAPWILWVHDLSIMDPYYILPVAMGATMYFQQKITPSSFTDPMQAKIMKFLPLIFTFFFVTFPAGLTLYWFTNNLFSIGQQYYVNSLFSKEKKAKVTIADKKVKK